jgi:hypothetical protein
MTEEEASKRRSFPAPFTAPVSAVRGPLILATRTGGSPAACAVQFARGVQYSCTPPGRRREE